MVACTTADLIECTPCSPFGKCVWKVSHLLEMRGEKSVSFLLAFIIFPKVSYLHPCLPFFLILVSHHLSPVPLPSFNYVKVLLGLYVCVGKKMSKTC